MIKLSKFLKKTNYQFQFPAKLATTGSATLTSAPPALWDSTSLSGVRPAAGLARSTPPPTGWGPHSPQIANVSLTKVS